jgi:hypothetical protein
MNAVFLEEKHRGCFVVPSIFRSFGTRIGSKNLTIGSNLGSGEFGDNPPKPIILMYLRSTAETLQHEVVAYESKGRVFESRRAHHKSFIEIPEGLPFAFPREDIGRIKTPWD